MKNINKRFVAVMTTIVLLVLTVSQIGFAEDAVLEEEIPKVEFVLSEPDTQGYLTASIIIYDATFSGAQFGFSFDNTVLQFVNEKTKQPSEVFGEVATLYSFENEKGKHKFSQALSTVSNTEGKLRLAVYGMPSEVSDEGARITVGENGFKLCDFSMKVLKKGDPLFKLLDYGSVVYPKEAILADGKNDMTIDFEFVLPKYFGVSTEKITITPVPPKPSIETLREKRLVDSLILNIGNYAAVDDGYLKWIDDNNKNVVPFIEGDRTYLPLRFIGEAFGATVNWNPDNQEITINLDGYVVIMNIGKTTYTVNGKNEEMDVAPFIKEDRTFVPVRYIGEALGKGVYWDATRKLVIVTPQERPWDPDGEAEKDILPDALLIISEFVRDMKATVAE